MAYCIHYYCETTGQHDAELQLFFQILTEKIDESVHRDLSQMAEQFVM